MTTATEKTTARLNYHGTIGVAAMQGRGFYYPWSAAVADDGRIFVLGRGSDSDPRGTRVTVMTLGEEYHGTFGSFGTGDGQAIWNASIAIDGRQRLFTSDDSLNRIQVRTLEGELLDTWGESGTEEGRLNGPTGITLHSNDELLVVDHLNGRVQRFTGDGKHLGSYENAAGGGPPRYEFREDLPGGIRSDILDAIKASRVGDYREKIAVLEQKQKISDTKSKYQTDFSSL